MTHLPDCDDYAFSGAGYHPNCERICICRQVRRIEQRVLDAAREAVAGIQDGPKNQPYWIDREAALTAIDALRIDTPKQQVMEHINLAVVEDA